MLGWFPGNTKEAINAYTDDGLINDHTVDFDIIDGKYSFRSDLDTYFRITEDHQQFRQKEKEAFRNLRAYFRKNGHPDPNTNMLSRIFEQVGGKPGWIKRQEEVYDPGGRKMKFISRAYSGYYGLGIGGAASLSLIKAVFAAIQVSPASIISPNYF